jgi:hypothetical protein
MRRVLTEERGGGFAEYLAALLMALLVLMAFGAAALTSVGYFFDSGEEDYEIPFADYTPPPVPTYTPPPLPTID